MKSTILWIWLLLIGWILPFHVMAQGPYGNDWVNKGQKYYKIKIFKDGFYRVSYSDLSSAGINLQNPAETQIFFHGKQIPIAVVHPGSGTTFDANDYIEFYGLKNVGDMDSVFYGNVSDQPQRSISFYTDTSVYFLTWKSNDTYNRITEANGTSTSFTAPSDFTETITFYPNSAWQPGKPVDPTVGYYMSEYWLGEGYLGSIIQMGGSPGFAATSGTYTITTPGYDSTAGNPKLAVPVYGESDETKSGGSPDDHGLYIDVKSKSAASYHSVFGTASKPFTYDGFKFVGPAITLDPSDLSGGSVSVKVWSIQVDQYNTANRQAIAYARVTYPRTFASVTTLPYAFNYTNGSGDKISLFTFSKLKTTKKTYLYDIDNGIRNLGFVSGTTLNFNNVNKGSRTHYFIYDTTLIGDASISGTFSYDNSDPLVNNFDPGNGANFIIITSARLLASAKDYAAYRKTTKYDSNTYYNPAIYTVEALYDLYYYGIQHHCIALRNFIAWYYNNATNKPKFLLFIGRGMEYSTMRGKNSFNKDFVPNIGSPPSDLLYVNGMDNNVTTLNPQIAVGRISARTDDSVRTYLDKVKDYESQQPAPWMKNVIHVCGGDAGAIQDQIRGEMNSTLRPIIIAPFIGANVWSYYNNSANAVNQTSAQQISTHINAGASLLTYFGHGSGIVLGVPIGDPGIDIINPHKYPVMYMNGCNLGNPTYDGNDFIAYQQLFTKNAGAIVWMSHSAVTYTSSLSTQMENFYNNISTRYYGKTVGECWAKTNFDFDSLGKNSDNSMRNIAYTWVLQGDPAIRLPYESLPDYTFDPNNGISVFPSYAIASDPTITLRLHVVNLGKYDTRDSFSIKVERKFPGNAQADSFYFMGKFPALAFDSTYQLVLKNQPGISQGNNTFCVTLDYDNKVRESNESNNNLCLQFYLNGNGIRQLSPLDYSIVSTATPDLVVQNRNLTGYSTGSYIEIDTSQYFRSPRKIKGYILGSAIMKYKPLVDIVKNFGKTDNDTLVIYWRARLDVKTGDGAAWSTQSFTYMPASPPGWSQSHWEQYKSIKGNNVQWDTLGKQFEFKNVFGQLILNTHPYYKAALGVSDGNLSYMAGVCSNATMVAIQFDGLTLQPKDLYATPLDCNPKPSNRAYKMFNLRQDTGATSNVGARQDFNKFIRNIPKGDYVTLVTRGAQQNYSQYDTATLNTFSKYLGSKDVTILASSSAYDTNTTFVLLAQREGASGRLVAEAYKRVTGPTTNTTTKDVNAGSKKTYPIGTTDAQILTLNAFMSRALISGSITSTIIGPSSKWQGVYQKLKSLEKPSTDTTMTYIYGVDSNQKVVKILDSFNTYSHSLTDTTIFNPHFYPYLQLVTKLRDGANHTPAQTKIWTVLYDGVPEGTLALDASFKFNKPQMKEGDTIKVQHLRFVNISKYPFRKNLPVKFNIVDINGRQKDAWYYIYPRALQPDSTINLNITRSSVGLSGDNVLAVFANPHSQPEVLYDNNIMDEKFNVIADKLNPILDVTFDGRHIQDGELVSAKPDIIITNKDENKSRLLVDTSTMKIALKGPNDGSPVPVSFLSGQLVFTPGSLANNNKAKVEYRPQNLGDGTYELHVQAFDESGNKSGNHEYVITFEIITKSKVSNVFVYPNPFTTKAKFVFTLTGSEVPDYMKIQIMTITGRVVKEIRKEELGPMRIGNNISQYTWDGTDEFGSLLANGLYMYRVVVKDATGKQFDNYGTSADRDFAKNFGKLYIIR